MLTYLAVHRGEWVTERRLAEVADACVDVARTLRQARADGWPLDQEKPGRWRLRAEERGAPRGKQRTVPARLRVSILERDGGCCQLCGSAAGAINLDGRPTRLEVDHVVPWHHGGATTAENLRTLCHVCNHDRQDAGLGADAPTVLLQPPLLMLDGGAP